jgi:acyl-CoA synthetase (AMP-forming)/AMP-acid ligase II
VGRGDRVAWLGPNHPAFLEALFASGLVGAALAPVNHRLAADGVRAVLADIEPRVLVQHAAPFFRVGGTGVNVLPVLFMGGTVVVPSDLRPDGILQVMQRHRVTVGFGNPDLLDAATRREATSRGTRGSWIGWRTASSRMAGPSTRATWSGC